eukprot:337340_1
METIIQFKSLLHSLKPSEYHSFLETVTNIFKNDITLFGYTMFLFFMKQLNSEEEEETSNLKIQYLNDIMLDLIEQRKQTKLPNKINSKVEKKEISTINIPTIRSINEFPNHIIQHITYFLSLKDHARFENCNRKLFVAARTPSLVYSLGSNNRWLSLYMWQLPVLQFKPVYNDMPILRRKKISMNRFHHVRKLKITKENAKYLSLRKWNNITEIKMCGITSKTFTELNNCINYDSVTKLSFIYSESKAIYNVLNHCSNVIDFSVWNSDINYFNAYNMSQLQMKLKSVIFSDLRGNASNIFAEYILNQNSETLETVTFGAKCPSVYLRNIESIKFKKLNKFIIGVNMWQRKGILSLISNCIMLDTLIVRLDEFIEYYEEQEEIYHDGEISNLIETMIKSVTLRNIIFINNHKDYFSMIVESIEKHLVSKRKFLSLDLNFTISSKDDLVSVKRLVHCLNSWCSKGFVLKLEYWLSEFEEMDDELEERCLDWMQEMNTFVVVKGELKDSGSIIIKKR